MVNWQIAYIVGGVLGLLLLLIRMGTLESGMFHQMNEDGIKRGDLKLIFFKKSNLIKYIQCIVIGIPIWFVIGLLIMNSEDNFGPMLGLNNVKNGYALMYSYIGLAVGDLVAGLLSQLFKSRRKVVMIFLTLTLIVTSLFLFGSNQISLETYYFYCFLLGASTGYWAIFVTIAAEQFGTNIRSTAANTIPNFVRGSVNLVVLFFTFLVSNNINDGISALVVGLTFIALALASIYKLKETFGKDLNYMEELS
jgi:MFS family permease